MSFPHRAQILNVGGKWLTNALDYILDQIHVAPYRIGNISLRVGTGTPEGVVRGSVGDLYFRTDGAVALPTLSGGPVVTLYAKTSGTGTTGWTALAQADSSGRVVLSTTSLAGGPLPIALGGTEVSSLTAGCAVLGNGASPLQTNSNVGVFSGSIFTMGGGTRVPSSGGTAIYGVDASGTGSALTIANNGTAQPFSNANVFGGLFLVHDTTVTGELALFLGGQALTLVAQTGATYTTISGTAGKINVYLNATPAIEIENKQGNSIAFRVLGLRTRSQA